MSEERNCSTCGLSPKDCDIVIGDNCGASNNYEGWQPRQETPTPEERSCVTCGWGIAGACHFMEVCSRSHSHWQPEQETSITEEKSCFDCMREAVCNETGAKCRPETLEYYKPRFRGNEKDHKGFAMERDAVRPSGPVDDAVNHPTHYTSHPSGIEAIQVTEHMSFCIGNAMKYLWRADLKHDDGGIEDLEKAAWYVAREIERRSKNV